MKSLVLLSFLSDLDAVLGGQVENILEVINIVIGIFLLYVAYRTFNDQSNPVRIGTSAFWGILGVLFLGGTYLPPLVSGILVFSLGILTLLKQVKIGTVKITSDETAEKRANKLGSSVFWPVLALGITSLIFSTLFPSIGKIVLGFGAIASLILTMIILQPRGGEYLDETDRMVQQVGTTGILPQILAALGATFTAAGVGDVIASMIGGVIPEGHKLFGVIAYVLGMVIFTMIMGNAFAAFAVITAGIGIPFVLNLGADPVVVGTLALTAGYCGTLLTPMAGNFNALPAALLEMKDEYGVIKQQALVALVMIVAHIVLMYFWAF